MELSKIYGVSEQALKLSAKRADILANNIVNSSTPGFKARDLDFKSILQNEKFLKSSELQTTNPQHIALNSLDYSPALQYRIPMQPSLDGNTVDPNIERVNFMENAMKYQVSLNFVNSTTEKLKKAIQGE